MKIKNIATIQWFMIFLMSGLCCIWQPAGLAYASDNCPDSNINFSNPSESGEIVLNNYFFEKDASQLFKDGKIFDDGDRTRKDFSAVFGKVNDDDKIDLIITYKLRDEGAPTYTEKVNFYKNTGNSEPPFFELDSAGSAILETALGDWSDIVEISLANYDNTAGDDRDDLFVGRDGQSYIEFYDNQSGATTLSFVKSATNRFGQADADSRDGAKASFGDIDGDNDLDVIFGRGYGRISYYKNNNGSFVYIPDIIDEGGSGETYNEAHPLRFHTEGNHTYPELVDLDNDGDLDLISGRAVSNSLKIFVNKGSDDSPLFELYDPDVADSEKQYNWIMTGDIPDTDGHDSIYPATADIDGNGYPDLIIAHLLDESSPVYYEIKYSGGNVDASDDVVDLKDAILALHVLAGTDLSSIGKENDLCLNADINVDSKIGLEEVIFILRKISGLPVS